MLLCKLANIWPIFDENVGTSGGCNGAELLKKLRRNPNTEIIYSITNKQVEYFGKNIYFESPVALSHQPVV